MEVFSNDFSKSIISFFYPEGFFTYMSSNKISNCINQRPNLVQKSVATHCPYCALQCAMWINSDNEGNISIQPRSNPPQQFGLCQKGWTAGELINDPSRIKKPLMRESVKDDFQETSWEYVIDWISKKIKDLQTKHGNNSVAVFGGGGLSNEKAYSLGKFTRACLGSAMIDYNGRFCMSSAATALNRSLGLDRGMSFPLDDIAHAKTVIFFGSNPAETMPPMVSYLNKQKQSGGSLVVVDPRITPTAKLAHLHIQPRPGTDMAVILAITKLVLEDVDVFNYAKENDKLEGFDDLVNSLDCFDLILAEEISGVPVSQIKQVAKMLLEQKPAIVISGRGIEQSSKGSDSVNALINLCLVLDLIGSRYSGFGTLTGQGNGQGGREHGQKSDQLPGYCSIKDPKARSKIASIWKIEQSELPYEGLPAIQLFDALGKDKGPKALLVFGSNPVVSAPFSNKIQQNLDSLDLLVVADFFLSETAKQAHVVLPVAQWAEESGTMTNLEGRVLLRQKAFDPPTDVKDELWVISRLAKALNPNLVFPEEASEVFEELKLATQDTKADYSGISYKDLEQGKERMWPSSSRNKILSTPRPFEDKFSHEQKAKLIPVFYVSSKEIIDKDYPLYLTTGRILNHYQSGTQTSKIAKLVAASPQCFVEIHSDLGREMGIQNGDLIRIQTRRDIAIANAKLTNNIRYDTIFMPFHWSGIKRANLLTSQVLDPLSFMPEFKLSAARIEKV